MQAIKSISIPTPCHEDWQQMAPVEQGRHCQSCCKTVVDFSEMPTGDIIKFLSARSNTCGRITETKMAAVNHQLTVNSAAGFTWKGFIAAASLSVLFPITKAQAQGTVKIEQAPVVPKMLGKIAATDTLKKISGVVKIAEDSSALLGATISIKGNNISTHSSATGTYALDVPGSADTLEVSFIGYKTAKIKIDPLVSEYNIVLEPIIFYEERVVFAGGVVVRRTPFYKRWWYKLKHIF